MTTEDSLELHHTGALLDIVLGVVIALPLLELPVKVKLFIENPTYSIATSILLLSSALVFCAFYWLEVRHFLEEQILFNQAIGRLTPGKEDGVPLPMAVFLLGSLAMISIAAASLKFAILGMFKAFLAANVFYWIADVIGTISLKHNYKPWRKCIERGQKKYAFEHSWFMGHIVSKFFYVYGLCNILVFTLLLYFDYSSSGSELYRMIAASFLLLVVIFRHAFVRSVIYRKWIRSRVFHLE